MLVYLIRHPPPIDVEGLCYGRLDVAVNEPAIAGIADSVVARISRETLASARVYCSPSSRCMGLARCLASPREPTVVEDLVEMNFGDWQGTRWDAIAREKIDAWTNDVWGYRPGGGESAKMVAIRWERWLYHVRRNDGGNVVAVTHAGVIRVALTRAGRINGASALEAHIPFGSVHRLDLE
ncbi:MAG TPA: histidine phosphatase family protein [Steroidobacteraceae bacterium]|nr:histidine phosphatase family protein [Steroidobacteraceae bacterium]